MPSTTKYHVHPRELVSGVEFVLPGQKVRWHLVLVDGPYVGVVQSSIGHY